MTNYPLWAGTAKAAGCHLLTYPHHAASPVCFLDLQVGKLLTGPSLLRRAVKGGAGQEPHMPPLPPCTPSGTVGAPPDHVTVPWGPREAQGAVCRVPVGTLSLEASDLLAVPGGLGDISGLGDGATRDVASAGDSQGTRP